MTDAQRAVYPAVLRNLRRSWRGLPEQEMTASADTRRAIVRKVLRARNACEGETLTLPERSRIAKVSLRTLHTAVRAVERSQPRARFREQIEDLERLEQEPHALRIDRRGRGEAHRSVVIDR